MLDQGELRDIMAFGIIHHASREIDCKASDEWKGRRRGAMPMADMSSPAVSSA